MSKNIADLGVSPLNLSLTGKPLSQNRPSSGRNSSSRRVQGSTYSQRSYLSSSSSNLSSIESNKKLQQEASKLNLSSTRSNSIYNLIDGKKSTKSQKPPSAPTGASRKARSSNSDEKKESASESNTESTYDDVKSYAFVPLSVRSSIDEYETGNTKMVGGRLPPTSPSSSSNNSTATRQKASGLDLFFQSIENEKSAGKKQNAPSNASSARTITSEDLNAIKPLKDEQITKLKESTNNLRKELQFQTIQMTNYEQSRLNVIKRNIAARKIQRWYRNKNEKKTHVYQDELERLFSDKRNEMRKKIEKNIEKSSIFNRKPTTKTTTSTTAAKNSMSSIKTASSIAPNTNASTASSIVSEKAKVQQSKNAPFDSLMITTTSSRHQNSIHDGDQFLKASIQDDRTLRESLMVESLKIQQSHQFSNKNSTVESLLMDLEKIERESENLFKLNGTDSDSQSVSGSVKSEKVNSILSFLDEATTKEKTSFTPRVFKDFTDYKIEFEQHPSTSQTKKPTESTATDLVKSTKPRKNSLTNQSTSVIKSISKNGTNEKIDPDSKTLEVEKSAIVAQTELQNKVLTMKLELEEKKRTVAMLEKALNQQRELTIRHTQEADKEMQIRLEAQKNDYEATIQRHLNFIDQLIDDKKVLSEKCEKLVKEMKDSEKHYSDRIKMAEEKYKIDTQKLKDTFEAAEKIRREKWIEEKTKKIKEMTVKGLEPEIQALINKHKNEIKSMKAIHEAELMQADERAAQRYIKITEELRENYEREKESTIQRERDVCKQRYEKSLEEEEKSFLEQRRRLYAEVEEEKNRVAEQAALQRKELDRLRKMLEENNFNTIETIKKEYTNSQSELEKKHQAEIQNLKEKLDIEKQSWEQNYLKKQENWMIQKERELKEQVKRERDKEIELVISRLESESTLTREESDRAAENRIKRVRDKYESELREVEKTERETMERYNTLKAKYNELEGEYERLKVISRQKEKDLEGIKKLTDTLQEERNRLADVLRQEFSDRIVFTEEENKRIKHEMAEIKSRHQYELDKKKEELEKVQKEKTDELNTVHEKIKQVVAKKDEAFAQLKQQYDAACKRADHLEGLLEQQRTLMLKKKDNNS